MVPPSLIKNLAHIFFTGPALIYVGIHKTSNAPWIFRTMAIVGGILFFYFLWKFAMNVSELWYLVHAIIFMSLIFYVGWKQGAVNPTLFSFLIAIGFGAIGYHSYRFLGATIFRKQVLSSPTIDIMV